MVESALVVFTKTPIPSITKTRLTLERGGPLSVDEAAKMYESFLKDIISVTLEIRRMRNGCGLFIAFVPKERKEDLVKMLGGSNKAGLDHIALLPQMGEGFGDRVSNTFESVFERGYKSVVLIGGDSPTIQPQTVLKAFEELERLDESVSGAMVVGPCQEGGVYLIGLTRNTQINLGDIFDNPQRMTVLEALVEEARAGKTPVAMLEEVLDVDVASDLASLASTLKLMEYSAKFHPDIAVPRHTLRALSDLHIIARLQGSGETRGITIERDNA